MTILGATLAIIGWGLALITGSAFMDPTPDRQITALAFCLSFALVMAGLWCVA